MGRASPQHDGNKQTNKRNKKGISLVFFISYVNYSSIKTSKKELLKKNSLAKLKIVENEDYGIALNYVFYTLLIQIAVIVKT